MRLWHIDLLSAIPDNQLCSQHRECCALRGKGWGKKHSVINYIYNYPIEKLIGYHLLVMKEMKDRGKWQVDPIWYKPNYRGKILGFDDSINPIHAIKYMYDNYPEHNHEYMIECIDNILEKLRVKDQSLKVIENIKKLEVIKDEI